MKPFRGKTMYDFTEYIEQISTDMVKDTDCQDAVSAISSMMDHAMQANMDIMNMAIRGIRHSEDEFVINIFKEIEAKCSRMSSILLSQIHRCMRDSGLDMFLSTQTHNADTLIAAYRIIDPETMEISFTKREIDVEFYLNNDDALQELDIATGNVRTMDMIWLCYYYGKSVGSIATYIVTPADKAMQGFYTKVRNIHDAFKRQTEEGGNLE